VLTDLAVMIADGGTVHQGTRSSATVFGECCLQLLSAADVELAVSVSEMDLDSAFAQEQALRDFSVCGTTSGELGDAALACGQGLGTGEYLSAWSGSRATRKVPLSS
jgi:hypothetical protein